jgi:hypothetical protein
MLAASVQRSYSIAKGRLPNDSNYAIHASLYGMVVYRKGTARRKRTFVSGTLVSLPRPDEHHCDYGNYYQHSSDRKSHDESKG